MRIRFFISGSAAVGLGHVVRTASVVNALPDAVMVEVVVDGDDGARRRLRDGLRRPAEIRQWRDAKRDTPAQVTVLDSIDERLVADATRADGGRIAALVTVPEPFRPAVDLLVLRATPPDTDGYRDGVVRCGPQYATVDPALPAASRRADGQRLIGILVSAAYRHPAMESMHAAFTESAPRFPDIDFAVPAAWTGAGASTRYPVDRPWSVLHEADCIVTGPGISAFECAYVGVPAVYWCYGGETWTVAELAAAGAGQVVTGNAADALARAVDGAPRPLPGRTVVDGEGARRIAELLCA